MDHLLEAHLNVEFPLSIIANNLTLADTIDLSLNSDNINGEIISGNLILHADNGYPFDANIALELLDGNNNLISEIVSSDKIIAAPVNVSLIATSKQSSMVTYSLSATDITNLYTAKRIAVKVAFNSTNPSQHLKIYENYELDITLVGDFIYNLNLE